MIDNDYVTPHLFLKKNIIILCSGSSDKRQLTSWRQTSFCVYFHLCISNRTSVFKFQISQCPNSLLMSCYGQNISFSKFFWNKANLISQSDQYNIANSFWFEAYAIKSMNQNQDYEQILLFKQFWHMYGNPKNFDKDLT